ncbi:MAG: DNA polymerase III subunit delta, partial [Caulobacteraceae bacterium]
ALIHGPDTGLVRARGATLAAATTERPDDPFNVALLSETELVSAPARLEEELSAFSMLGGRRLVRLRLAGDKGQGEETALEGLRRHLAGALNPAAFLIIEAGVLRKGAALRTSAEKADNAGAIACYPEETGDRIRLARQRLALDKVGLTSEALERFAARLPGEHGVALAEIERLALYLGPGSGHVAGAADLDDFLGVEPEASLADAAYDAFGGKAAAAHAGLRRAAREGDAGASAVRAMGAHLARLRRAVAAHRAGGSLTETVRSLQIFWKVKDEFIRQARAWPAAAVEQVQAQVWSADDACRRTGAPDALIAERLTLAIASRARRLGL